MRVKNIAIVLAVFAACFLFFNFQAKRWLGTVAAQKDADISNVNGYIDGVNSELKDPAAKSGELLKEDQQVCKELTVSLQAIIDGWNSGDWEKRIRGEARYLELKLQKNKFGIFYLNDEAYDRDTLAFDRALLQWHAKPRDRGEDGISSVYSLLQDWMLYLLPLCVLLLTSDLISAERATGSIKLLLQKRKPRPAIYIQKLFYGLKWSCFALLGAILGAFSGGAVVGGTGSLSYPVLFNSSYVQTWKIFLLCLPVVVLSILFYTAVGLLVSALFRSRVLPVLGPAAGVFALVFFGRKTVTAAHGNLLQYFPLECSDPVTAVFGKFSVPIKETLTNPMSGQTILVDSPYSVGISTALPLWGSIFVLFAWSVLFLIAGLWIFNREDLT